MIDDTTVWDEKVLVEAGKDTALTLSKAASPVPADNFAAPEQGRALEAQT